jgi:hypothetical protein
LKRADVNKETQGLTERLGLPPCFRLSLLTERVNNAPDLVREAALTDIRKFCPLDEAIQNRSWTAATNRLF